MQGKERNVLFIFNRVGSTFEHVFGSYLGEKEVNNIKNYARNAFKQRTDSEFTGDESYDDVVPSQQNSFPSTN